MRVIGLIYSLALIAVALTQGFTALFNAIQLLVLISFTIFVVKKEDNINK